jgi:UDP:flavonoid glycosyltransferase YjiC (YdhE family)
MLLAGKPMLQLPQHVEQYHVAKRVAGLGAGISLQSAEQTAIESALDELLTNGSYLRAARAFADQYRGHDPKAVLQRVVDRIESLASRFDDPRLAIK